MIKTPRTSLTGPDDDSRDQASGDGAKARSALRRGTGSSRSRSSSPKHVECTGSNDSTSDVQPGREDVAREKAISNLMCVQSEERQRLCIFKAQATKQKSQKDPQGSGKSGAAKSRDGSSTHHTVSKDRSSSEPPRQPGGQPRALTPSSNMKLTVPQGPSLSTPDRSGRRTPSVGTPEHSVQSSRSGFSDRSQSEPPRRFCCPIVPLQTQQPASTRGKFLIERGRRQLTEWRPKLTIPSEPLLRTPLRARSRSAENRTPGGTPEQSVRSTWSHWSERSHSEPPRPLSLTRGSLHMARQRLRAAAWRPQITVPHGPQLSTPLRNAFRSKASDSSQPGSRTPSVGTPEHSVRSNVSIFSSRSSSEPPKQFGSYVEHWQAQLRRGERKDAAVWRPELTAPHGPTLATELRSGSRSRAATPEHSVRSTRSTSSSRSCSIYSKRQDSLSQHRNVDSENDPLSGLRLRSNSRSRGIQSMRIASKASPDAAECKGLRSQGVISKASELCSPAPKSKDEVTGPCRSPLSDANRSPLPEQSPIAEDRAVQARQQIVEKMKQSHASDKDRLCIFKPQVAAASP